MDKVNANRFRRERLRRFLQGLPKDVTSKATVKVLDVGGTTAYWSAMQEIWQDFRLDITLVNLDTASSDDGPLHVRPGNACAMPEYDDNAFDVVHSNSVIEHVGHWPEMMAMANEVRRLAPHYYVQTPNFWFPYEPHYRTPLFQFLPESMRAARLQRRRHGFRGPYKTVDGAMRDLQTVVLLDRRQLAALFPDATIENEKMLGLTKSLIARR